METIIEYYSEEQFDEKFNLVDNHLDNNAAFDGKMFETYGEELAFVIEMSKQNKVITIIEAGGDEVDDEGYVIPNMYYTSGLHHVNRIGYLITDTPITYDFECLID
jgi:hypothetical protein